MTLTIHSERIDDANAQGLHNAASNKIEESGRLSLLDISEVKFLSSAGLRILLILAIDMNRRGGASVSREQPGQLKTH